MQAVNIKDFSKALQSCLDVVNHNRQELAPQTAQAAAISNSYRHLSRSQRHWMILEKISKFNGYVSLPTVSCPNQEDAEGEDCTETFGRGVKEERKSSIQYAFCLCGHAQSSKRG